MIFIEGFIIGLMGSLHCLGMCGPIVLAMPLQQKSTVYKATAGLAYHIGRTLTYSIMGVVLGIIGMGLHMVGVQRWVSMVMGAIIMLSVFMPGLAHKIGYKVNISSLISKYFSKLLKGGSIWKMHLMGLLNGLLPCGLVYIALANALTKSSVIKSTWFMFAFGVGTVPLMFILMYFGNVLKDKVIIKFRKLIPILIFILGALFVLRGLNLGVPYISPKLQNNEKSEVQHHCH